MHSSLYLSPSLAWKLFLYFGFDIENKAVSEINIENEGVSFAAGPVVWFVEAPFQNFLAEKYNADPENKGLINSDPDNKGLT